LVGLRFVDLTHVRAFVVQAPLDLRCERVT
jgi:hypothetical protein